MFSRESRRTGLVLSSGLLVISHPSRCRPRRERTETGSAVDLGSKSEQVRLGRVGGAARSGWILGWALFVSSCCGEERWALGGMESEGRGSIGPQDSLWQPG